MSTQVQSTFVPMSQSQVEALSPAEQLAYLKAENAALKAAPTRRLSLKVSEKGAVSLYGMGQFPVTLYGEQWIKVLDFGNEIRAFVEANKSSLKTKADHVLAKAAAKAAVN